METDFSFSNELMDSNLEQLISEDIGLLIDSLQFISASIMSATPAQVESYGVSKLCASLFEVFSKSELDFVVEMAAQGIRNILEIHGTAAIYLSSMGFIPAIEQKFNSDIGIPIIEHCIRALNGFCEVKAEEVANKLGIGVFLKYVDFLRASDQNICFETIRMVTQSTYNDSYIQHIGQLIDYVISSNPKISSLALQVLENIFRSIKTSNIDIVHIERLLGFMTNCLSPKDIRRILNIINIVTKDVSIASFFAKHSNLYINVLNTVYSNDLNDIIHRLCFLAIFDILPNSIFPPDLISPVHGSIDGALEFSKDMRICLMNYIIKHGSQANLCISAIASCLSLESFDVDEDFLRKVLGLSLNARNCPYILPFILGYKNQLQIAKIGILAQLNKLQPSDGQYVEWYKNGIQSVINEVGDVNYSVFKDTRFSTLDEMLDFLKSTSFSYYDFLDQCFLSCFLKLLSDSSPQERYDFNIITKSLCELLLFIPFEIKNDGCGSASPSSYSNIEFTVEVHFEGNTHTHSFGSNEAFGAIEAWINEEIYGIKNESLLGASELYTEMKSLIDLTHLNNLGLTELSILNRVFCTPDYHRFSFVYNDTHFRCSDPMFPSLLKVSENPNYWRDNNFLISLESEIVFEKKEFAPKHDLLSKDAMLVLDIIKHIHRVCPSKFSIAPNFLDFVTKTMKSPLLNSSMSSCGIQILTNFPSVFPSEIRIFGFKMLAMDFFSVLVHSNHSIFHNTTRFRDNRPFFSVKIPRGDLFLKGLQILETFAKGPVQLDFSFENEAGFGSGPTHEFFTLMGIEFSKKARNMWRNSSTGEYSFSHNGLFPSPNGDPKLFYLFGILCGKAVAMDIVVPIPLSLEFFKLIMNEFISLKDIDPVLYKSLNGNEEGLFGLPFTYPGIDSIELIENGNSIEVSHNNILQYREKIESFSIGAQVKILGEEFIRGFNEVININFLYILKPSDLQRLITGDTVHICYQDLSKYIEVAHGYTHDSIQVKLLFEIITEMDENMQSNFIQFVTGSQRLPIGGLNSLQPHICIAKKTDDSHNPDDCLPSVSTCTHYLKLPPYTTKEIMKTKLIYAILEGQESFDLT